ncbi:MAG: hypothetical protein GC154_11055 [bacterium]|nr:hypothetical protein [bacterium]
MFVRAMVCWIAFIGAALLAQAGDPLFFSAEDGHKQFGTGYVYDAAYSPTADEIAVLTSIGLFIYSGETHELLRYKMFDEDFRFLKYSPDGQYIALLGDLIQNDGYVITNKIGRSTIQSTSVCILDAIDFGVINKFNHLIQLSFYYDAQVIASWVANIGRHDVYNLLKNPNYLIFSDDSSYFAVKNGSDVFLFESKTGESIDELNPVIELNPIDLGGFDRQAKINGGNYFIRIDGILTTLMGGWLTTSAYGSDGRLVKELVKDVSGQWMTMPPPRVHVNPNGTFIINSNRRNWLYSSTTLELLDQKVSPSAGYGGSFREDGEHYLHPVFKDTEERKIYTLSERMSFGDEEEIVVPAFSEIVQVINPWGNVIVVYESSSYKQLDFDRGEIINVDPDSILGEYIYPDQTNLSLSDGIITKKNNPSNHSKIEGENDSPGGSLYLASTLDEVNINSGVELIFIDQLDEKASIAVSRWGGVYRLVHGELELMFESGKVISDVNFVSISQDKKLLLIERDVWDIAKREKICNLNDKIDLYRFVRTCFHELSARRTCRIA